MMRLFVFICAVTIYVSSCSPVYIANTWNVPVLTDKHNLNAGGSFGRSGFDCQLAYSVTSHIGIMANGSFSNSDLFGYHKHLFAEGGLGYSFQPVKDLVVETYGGFGIGNVSSNAESFYFYTPKNSRVNARLERFFIQPSVSYSYDFLQISFAPRISFVNIRPKEVYGVSSGYVSFFEPALILKLGNEKLKFVNQVGLSLDIRTEEANSIYTSRFESGAFYFSMGVQLSFGGKKAKLSIP